MHGGGSRFAVLGAGANGAAIGADLTRAGLDVVLIEQWPEHVETMRAHGVRVEMPGETVITPVHAFHFCEVAAMRDTFDIVLVAVKAYDTRWVCELIKPLLGPRSLVVGIQNGMTIDVVASVVGPERTLGAVIEIAGNMFVPGVVERQTPPSGTWFAVGAYDSATVGRESEVAAILRHAGEVEISDDIRSSKWMKLVGNAAEVLPSAILGLPLAEAIRIPGMRRVMEDAGREAIQAALALGQRIMPMFGDTRVEQNDPDQYAVALFDAILARWTLPTTKVAVLQDWMKGRRGEVDDINGVVVSELAKIGRAAPCNAKLVDLARRIEKGELTPQPSNAALLLADA
ncbi:MAG TPA: 2-dehydropantoate 2-reductase N-terminal domain-containing protein [Roseiarcus sp.]|jgi:2-dehydropantoate 2-reductase